MERVVKYRRVPIIGIILVLLGVALMLHQMHLVELSTMTLVWIGLMIYGGATVIRSFIFQERHKIFLGSFCFLTGMLFLLRKLDVIVGGVSMYFPAFLIIIGLSFLVLYIFDLREWHLLIPMVIFVGLGATLMLTQLGLWYVHDVWDAVRSYWPVLLIIIGTIMLIKRRS